MNEPKSCVVLGYRMSNGRKCKVLFTDGVCGTAEIDRLVAMLALLRASIAQDEAAVAVIASMPTTLDVGKVTTEVCRALAIDKSHKTCREIVEHVRDATLASTPKARVFSREELGRALWSAENHALEWCEVSDNRRSMYTQLAVAVARHCGVRVEE